MGLSGAGNGSAWTGRDHGARLMPAAPRRRSCAATRQYILLPGKNAAALAAYAAAPEIGIVENSKEAHAVAKPAPGLRAVNFWTDTVKASNGITCDRIASVLAIAADGAIQLAITDTTQANSRRNPHRVGPRGNRSYCEGRPDLNRADVTHGPIDRQRRQRLWQVS